MPLKWILPAALLSIIGICTGIILLAQEDKPPVVALELPDWRACLEGYGGDGSVLFKAERNGDTQAVRCTLALNYDQTLEDFQYLELYYMIYRLEGVEPEGLDAIVRRMDRQELATKLRLLHDFETWLEPFARHWWTFCTVYDRPARELLRRSIPSEDMSCMPRGRR